MDTRAGGKDKKKVTYKKKKIWTKDDLVEYEQGISELFEAGFINAPVHLSGGNEDQLISIFSNIKTRDFVFSTHRNHYHYLLKGGDPEALAREIQGFYNGLCKGQGRSMNVYDTSINFYTSAIVGGNCAIAVGVALSLKKKKRKAHVWCFLGDGAEDSGHFMESARFALARRLPVTFVIEDNDLSVYSTKADRWKGNSVFNAPNVLRYRYERTRPHVGTGKWVTF